jgi:hypothetical protein
MKAPVLEQKAAYRKGLVLGFTMAEITLMLLFCLLLASTLLVDIKAKQAVRTRQKLKVAQQKLKDNKRDLVLVEQFKARFGEQGKIDDLFTELRLVKESNTALKEEIESNKRQQAEFAVLREYIEDSKVEGKDPKAIIQEVERDKALADRVKAAMASAKLTPESPDKVEAIMRAGLAQSADVTKCKETEIEKERLGGQLKNAQRTLERFGQGKGTEKPACWADPKTGKPEYIFRVELTSGGLIIHDQKLPNRVDDQARLPIGGVTFDGELPPEMFKAQTAGLAAWSKERDCRFFVMVKDLTLPTEKDAYKKMLKTLEEHFYKLEIK